MSILSDNRQRFCLDVPESIRSLDLSRIEKKLATTLATDAEELMVAVERYRGFLTLLVESGETVVPTDDIDEVWHAHILDTRAYARDSAALFGRFMHHNPYIEEQDDPAHQAELFTKTAELWQSRFGMPYVGDGGMCNNGGCDGGSCNGPGD